MREYISGYARVNVIVYSVICALYIPNLIVCTIFLYDMIIIMYNIILVCRRRYTYRNLFYVNLNLRNNTNCRPAISIVPYVVSTYTYSLSWLQALHTTGWLESYVLWFEG